MPVVNKKEPLILLLGDIFCFLVALWLTLFLRYVVVPSWELWYSHVLPFSILFIFWTISFFIAGLYEKHTLLVKSRLPRALFNAQVANAGIATLFFYLIPEFGINPKTNLFLYLFISSVLIFLWRLYGRELFLSKHKSNSILIGSGEELEELASEINNNSRYSLRFVEILDVEKISPEDLYKKVSDSLKTHGVTTVVADWSHEKIAPVLPRFYALLFLSLRFVDFYKLYEETFDRVPLSMLRYSWFIQNISLARHGLYDLLRRLMDIVAAVILGIISLPVYPIVALLIKLDDGGPIFISQARVGKANNKIIMYKFRSMRTSDNGVWITESSNPVTRVGYFLRKTRIDELPQLWNILKGDISLIGPRPDISGLVGKLENEIPYYIIRYAIKPGLSGWAQIKQDKPPQSVLETKRRLAYDLYYIKNRSFILDLVITLRTIKTLLSRSGM